MDCGILSAGSRPINKMRARDDMSNDNENPLTPKETRTRDCTSETHELEVTHVSSGLEFSNAEALDRAIVNKLHSTMQASQTRSRPSSASRVEVILESECANTSNCRIHFSSPSPNEFQQPTTYTVLPSPATSDDILDDLQEAPAMQKRSVMYQNTMFELESNSKEALPSGCDSDSEKSFSEFKGLLKEDELDVDEPPPMTRNPRTFHRPVVRTLSTETIRGTEDGYSRMNLIDTGTEAGSISSRVKIMDSSFSLRPHSRDKRRSRSRSRSPSEASERNQPASTALSALRSSFVSSNIGDQLFDEAMNGIIEKGGDEFKEKYSSWVWDAFRNHLAQLKSLLLTEFNEKMKTTLDEREKELTELQQQYRRKLTEFDTTTDGFQDMIDNLYMENQKVLKAKDFVIEKLKKEFLECKRHFEQDLARQLQNYRKDAEVEKLELQKRNDELMMIMLTDASKCDLEDAFKREIQSLHKMIKALTTQNEVLHQQLDEATQSVTATSVGKQNSLETLKLQLDQAKQELHGLRQRLSSTETEKQDLDVNHHQQIAKLNRKIQESNTRYEHQLKDANEEIENLRKRHAKELREVKQKLLNQESQHNKEIKEVRYQYGGKVDSLSKAVSKLQAELTVKGLGKGLSYDRN